jgi:MFS family permease
MMTPLLRNTPIFSIAQGLLVSVAALVVSCAALVGFNLSPDKSLATLPVAVMYITTMLSSFPAALLLEKIGRKKGFMLSTIIGISGGAISTYAIINNEFWTFVIGIGLFGVFNSVGNFFRFAAADCVTHEFKSRAISFVTLGGIVAAFVGPNIANYAKDWITGSQFAGSFAVTIFIYLLMLLILSFLYLPAENKNANEISNTGEPRPLNKIVKQPAFIVAVSSAMLGYGVMAFMMTATPLAMQQHNHTFDNTAFVIQWHLLGMFIPSLFTGYLIRYVGIYSVLITGVLIGFTCVVINFIGHELNHYWASLALLGICWNFLFVGGTTLLTETYQANEKAKVQGLNDFFVFSSAAFASLSAGYIQFNFGWDMVNLGVIPVLSIILISIVWAKLTQTR